jgi:Protein kinase domain
MGRILVIYPEQGFLELLRRMLTKWREVEVFEHYQQAENRLLAGAAYEAVLCGLTEPGWAIKIFEKVAALSANTRLIPIAGDLTQLDSFRQQWNSDARRKQKYGSVGQQWLPARCTTGDVFGLFPSRAAEPAPDAVSKRTESNEVIPIDLDLPADQGSTGERYQKPNCSGTAAKPSGADPHEDGGEGAQRAESPCALGIGTIIDGYRLVCSIGHGGFGTAWMCVNGTTEKRLAIKFVEGEEQVCQELVALRKYVHVAEGNEHLIRVEHINSDASRLWLVTPLADSLTGGDTTDSYRPLSLANLLQAKGHLLEAEAVGIGLRVGRALSALHHAGLLHGDVAPGNILSVHGRWVLADPGLVRFLGEPGICRNRTYYPDLKASRPFDDLHALGFILWEMVSGVAEMVSGTERMRLDGRMVAFLSQTDLPIAKVICHAAAENPEQRYLNAGELLQDLEFVAAGSKLRPGTQNSLYNLPKIRSLRTSGAPAPLGGTL